MAVEFSQVNLDSLGKEAVLEKMIDKILLDEKTIRSRTRVVEGNYEITIIHETSIDPGSFIALRDLYIAAGWDDLIMVSSEALKLVKAIA